MGASARSSRPEARSISVARANDIALDHIRDRPGRWDLNRADLAYVRVTDAYRSRHNGVTHVYLRQLVSGLEVLGANMTVNVTREGDILYIGSRFRRNVHASASGEPVLTAAETVRAAARHLGLPATGPIAVLDQAPGSAQPTVLVAEGISARPVPAKLVYQPVDATSVRLAWNLDILEPSGRHWWNVSVDATNGSVLARFDYIDHDNSAATATAVSDRPVPAQSDAVVGPRARARDGASYRVFPPPLESPNDGKPRLIKNPADRLGSPFGWHDTDGATGPEFTTTRGNNVHAYADYTGYANVPLPFLDAEGGDSLTFDFPLDFEKPPHISRDAAITNLFFWNNVIHDVFYRYGFTEKAGNFQANNYGRGGADGDPVQAEAQDAGGVNNANFATPADGSSGRMQMYVWTSPAAGGRIYDGDLDAGVVVHEYAHGISNRLTGGPDSVDCLRSHDEREGEGWSDWLAIALTARRGDKGTHARGMGTYVLGQSGRDQKGIRPTPYSTSMKINPATYDTIRTSAEPHGVGYVWASMLWEVYWNLVKKHGFNPNPYDPWDTGGNNLAIQLVMDGMKMQPCEPGFVDARGAILAADVALTGGENRCAIWAGFAKRGLGYRADQGDPASKVDGKQNFATHPACR